VLRYTPQELVQMLKSQLTTKCAVMNDCTADFSECLSGVYACLGQKFSIVSSVVILYYTFSCKHTFENASMCINTACSLEKFAKISSLLNMLCYILVELAFENVSQGCELLFPENLKKI